MSDPTQLAQRYKFFFAPGNVFFHFGTVAEEMMNSHEGLCLFQRLMQFLQPEYSEFSLLAKVLVTK